MKRITKASNQNSVIWLHSKDHLDLLFVLDINMILNMCCYGLESLQEAVKQSLKTFFKQPLVQGNNFSILVQNFNTKNTLQNHFFYFKKHMESKFSLSLLAIEISSCLE